VAAVSLPSLRLAVISDDRSCRKVADELAKALTARPGVDVSPSAPVRLVVSNCDERIDSSVELNYDYMGLGYDDSVVRQDRRYTQHVRATAKLMVLRPDADSVTLPGTAERTARTWGDLPRHGSRELPAAASAETGTGMADALALREQVRRDLAYGLADKVAPLPERLKRIVYADPEPGTAQQLHNQAVEAERRGDLDEALRLARQAWAADPSAVSKAYIEQLEYHAARVGYALRGE
jgi:hypothetical protein